MMHQGIFMNKNIIIAKEKIREFCERHHINRLAIFGSALRDDFSDESDVDVLVDFEPGHVPGFFRLFEMQEELSTLFSGRKIDMRTPEDLSRYFREKVIATAQVQYVRG
jgi:predicted nucleotidyltransferase